VQIWTDATQLVVDRGDGPPWSVPLEGGTPQAHAGGLAGLRPLQHLDATLVRVLAKDLVRVSDIADRAGVTTDAVTRWRRDHREAFPDPIIPGWFYWPEVVAAGFGSPRPPGRPPRGDRSYPVRQSVRIDKTTHLALPQVAMLRQTTPARMIRGALTEALAGPGPLPVAATPATGGRYVRTVYLTTDTAAALADRARQQGVVDADGRPDLEPLVRGVLLAVLAGHPGGEDEE
jgi:hypothetical protein